MGRLAKSKPHHQHQLRPCAVDTSKHHEHQLCRLAKSKPGGPHHQHQLRPCAVDTSKRDSIMSISCGSACKKQARWPTSSASAAALRRRYQQTGQHHEHPLCRLAKSKQGGPHQQHQLRPCAVDTSKRASIMSISCGPACKQTASKWPKSSASAATRLPTYRQMGAHHEHQFWAGLPKASKWPTSSASAAGPFPKYQQA